MLILQIFFKIQKKDGVSSDEEIQKLHRVLFQRIRLEEHAIYNIYEECLNGMVKRAS